MSYHIQCCWHLNHCGATSGAWNWSIGNWVVIEWVHFVCLSHSTVLCSSCVYILCLWGMNPSQAEPCIRGEDLFASSLLLCGGCDITSIWHAGISAKGPEVKCQEKSPDTNKRYQLCKSGNRVIFIWGETNLKVFLMLIVNP